MVHRRFIKRTYFSWFYRRFQITVLFPRFWTLGCPKSLCLFKTRIKKFQKMIFWIQKSNYIMSVCLENTGTGVLLWKVKSSSVSLLIFNMPLRIVSQVQVSWRFTWSHSQGPAWVPLMNFKWNQIRAVVRLFVLVLQLQDLLLEQ